MYQHVSSPCMKIKLWRALWEKNNKDTGLCLWCQPVLRLLAHWGVHFIGPTDKKWTNKNPTIKHRADKAGTKCEQEARSKRLSPKVQKPRKPMKTRTNERGLTATTWTLHSLSKFIFPRKPNFKGKHNFLIINKDEIFFCTFILI